jgi:hypothetical protein
LNPQPPVLETGALPIELQPSVGPRRSPCGQAYAEVPRDEVYGGVRAAGDPGAAC